MLAYARTWLRIRWIHLTTRCCQACHGDGRWHFQEGVEGREQVAHLAAVLPCPACKGSGRVPRAMLR